MTGNLSKVINCICFSFFCCCCRCRRRRHHHRQSSYTCLIAWVWVLSLVKILILNSFLQTFRMLLVWQKGPSGILIKIYTPMLTGWFQVPMPRRKIWGNSAALENKKKNKWLQWFAEGVSVNFINRRELVERHSDVFLVDVHQRIFIGMHIWMVRWKLLLLPRGLSFTYLEYS